jgi:hypothetical protein
VAGELIAAMLAKTRLAAASGHSGRTAPSVAVAPFKIACGRKLGLHWHLFFYTVVAVTNHSMNKYFNRGYHAERS